jgi:hypothetical protein
MIIALTLTVGIAAIGVAEGGHHIALAAIKAQKGGHKTDINIRDQTNSGDNTLGQR